jgi:four helix bundle protein
MLVAYQVAVELIRELRPIVEVIKRHDDHLADQLHRAATNTVANLAEGQRREKGNKRRAYENAHGEAREVLGCLDCANAWGWTVDDQAAREARPIAGVVLGPHPPEAEDLSEGGSDPAGTPGSPTREPPEHRRGDARWRTRPAARAIS